MENSTVTIPLEKYEGMKKKLRLMIMLKWSIYSKVT